MLKEDADRDLREVRRRIARQEDWIEQLRAVGQVTMIAEQELAELKATLDHIEHHRAVLEFSLRGISQGLMQQGA
jgi:hypothetical protein